MKALYKINPSLHNNLSHMKRVGIFTWILGWGVFSNARSISKIKNNLHVLQKQNQLQDKQIKQLANCARARAQLISQRVDAGQFNIPPQQQPITLSLTRGTLN